MSVTFSRASRALLFLFVFLPFLHGCLGEGGGSQSRPDNSPDGSVSGQVLDPPISGAQVRLVDVEGNALSALVRSDDQGRFTLQYRGGTSGARLVASGGRDAGTGLSFQGLSLSAPLAENGDGIVSPITTLVAHLTAQGFSLDGARQRVAQRLGLDPERLLASPEAHGDLQQRAVLVAQFLSLLQGEQNPADLLWQAVNQYGTDLDDAARALAGDDLLLASTRQRLEDNAELLATLAEVDQAGTAQAVLDRASLALVSRTLTRYLSESLDYTAADDTGRDNLQRLAEAIWQANQQRGLQPASPAGLNVVRYLMNHYGITTDALAQAGFTPPADLAGDSTVAELANRDAIDPTQPLAPAERLGDDQEARRAYFYRTTLSPFYRSEQLFQGVYDDNYLDPLYAAIAEGQARAGLLDDATRTLRTQVFNPRERVDAFRDAGAALLDQDQEEQATKLLDRSAQEFSDYLDGVGLRNIVFQDAENAFHLVRAYIKAGHPDRADATLAPLYDYVDLYADPGGEWNGSYYNINSALVDLAEDQVQQAENQGLREPYYQQAVTSTRLAQRWTDGLGRQGGPLTCASIQTQYTARYTTLFARLGLEDEARAGMEAFAELLPIPCNGYSTSFTNMIAPAYGYLEDFEGFERFLTEVVTPIPPLGSYGAMEARKAIRAQRATALVKNESVQAAQDYLAGELGDDLVGQVTLLTFEGGGIQADDDYELGNANRYVLNTLHDQNRDDLARAVSDAAWELVSSQAYQEQYPDAKNGIEQGCRKLAVASEYLGNMEQARERMAVCAERALSLVPDADTVERYNLLRLAGEGLYHFELTDQLPSVAARLGDLSNALSGKDRITVQGLRLRLLAASDDDDGTLAVFDQLRAQVHDLATAAAEESERTTAATAAKDLLNTVRYAANKLRGRTAERGEPVPSELALAHSLEQQARRYAAGDTGDQLNALGVIQRINGLSRRNDDLKNLARLLGRFDDLEAARKVAETVRGQARYDRLAAAADGLAERDLFPGTDLASLDFDLDGRPDFFNPSATLDTGTTPALTLDDDIDGDGTPDDADATPYGGNRE